MSSCISSGRGYGFELDIVKPSSPSSGRSSSPPSSTLSESSNSPGGISIKRARAPRKRPNQTYNEAAALLSTIYPTVFSAKSLMKHSMKASLAAFPESPDLLPPFPVLSNAAFLIHQPPPENRAADLGRELKHKIPADRECASPVSTVSWDPNSPTADHFDDDFDAESILDEEVGGGIDSILDNLGPRTATGDSNNDESNYSNPCINPLLRSLIGQNMGAKFELGLGSWRNLQRALRNRDGGDWWRNPTTVPVGDINPDFKPIPPPRPASKKKKKKKVEEKEAENESNSANSTPTPSLEKLKAGLGLKLSHEEVLTAWSGRGSMFTDSPDSRNSSADALVGLADIDLFLVAGGGGSSAGGVREASVLRYKEKRRTRLFSRKIIRYEVRKANADRRPRMKASGRFVRRPSSQLLQQAAEEEESR